MLFSCSVLSDSLKHARLPCPSPSPGVCSNSCPLSWWYHPTISSSVIPFSSCIRVFSNESSLCIRWPKYWSFSFSISPSNEYSGLISFRIDWFEIFAVRGTSTTVEKHQLFGVQPSLWSNSHIYTWLLEKPWIWLDGPLLAKECLCFLICCLYVGHNFSSEE